MSNNGGITTEYAGSKFLNRLPIMSAILFSVLFIVILVQEYYMFLQQGDGSALHFFKYILDIPWMFIANIAFIIIAIIAVKQMIKYRKNLEFSRMYMFFSNLANIPILVLKNDRTLFWNNLESISFLKKQNPQTLVLNIFEDKIACEKMDDCFKTGKSTYYEKTIKIDSINYWFHITFTKINNYKNNALVSATMSDISNMKEANEKIDNQQRELQMQTEMLSLITAQMEVQQAGIKEQNELLSEQHKQLEQQARMLQDANDELEYRNKQIITKNSYITDSIRYAQTIQEAMLPASNQLENNFFNNFIIYKPKDIVSGDFYWYSINEEYVYAVLGDCTGHGVPGAFMSMIGTRILGELINENKMDRPSVILETMHERIVAALKQDETENNDGMDIAICRIKKVSAQDHDYELKYAGAKQPIFIKRKGVDEVEQAPADRRGIGGHSYANFFFFEDRDYYLNIGDRIYLTTDGIKDQNNMLRKRFGTKRLEMMLSITSTLNIRDQKIFIDNIINNWQGLEEQRDDISLWGIELGEHQPSPYSN